MAKILVVDDEESSRILLSEILTGAGHDVTTADDGRETIDLIKQQAFGAVVTDLRMPLLNGLRLIKALRGVGDTIPIFAVSGTNADQLMLAQDHGANARLTKPLNREKLLEILGAALADTRSSWTDAWIPPEFGSVGDY